MTDPRTQHLYATNPWALIREQQVELRLQKQLTEDRTMAFGCVNNTIRLRSGIYFDLADPKPATVTMPDIAGALSKICRFGGQCERFYSVAEHSVLCAKIAMDDGLPPCGVLAVLLHDAAEAFVGDCVKPLKIMLPQYSDVERRVEAAIAEAFDVSFTKWADEIREIDHAMLIAERHAMFSKDQVTWTGEDAARRVHPQFRMSYPPEAEIDFVAMFGTVTRKDHQ